MHVVNMTRVEPKGATYLGACELCDEGIDSDDVYYTAGSVCVPIGEDRTIYLCASCYENLENVFTALDIHIHIK